MALGRLLVEYLPHYTDRERRRHEMRPGITGWAAVSGRHTLPFEERLELDAWYVDNWSFVLDVRILAITVGQVLGRSGVREIAVSRRSSSRHAFKVGLADSPADRPASRTAGAEAGGLVDPGNAREPGDGEP